jgi:hypothetical protein
LPHATSATQHCVRPFVERDIERVADLHRRVFRGGGPTDAASVDPYRRYFADVFLSEGRSRSLVFDRDGIVLGFLGVVHRPMTFKGRPVVMAACSQFAVDPAGRGQVGLRLLKACFAGPQDLTISDEAGDNTRVIWEWCAGETVPVCSLQWMRPLQPAALALALLARRKSPALRRTALIAAARLVDAVVSRTGTVRLLATRGSRHDLDEATLVKGLTAIEGGRALLPEYDERSVDWAIRRAGQRPGYGPVRKIAVRTGRDGISGWFLYCLSDDGIAEVLQVAARPNAVSTVLDHLFEDAEQQGASGVCGRLEPRLLAALSDRRVLFFRGNYWTLLHTRDTGLRHAIHGGNAFLSPLEGEWCLRYP